MTFAGTPARLRLEPVAPSHVRELTRLAVADRLDDELARAIPYCTGEEWLAEIGRERAEGSAEVYVAVTDNGEIAGTLRLGGMLTAESCQLSYWTAIEQRCKGYATAAARQAVALAFDQHGRERVCSFVREENTASARVLERAGLRPTGRARDGMTTWICIRAERQEDQWK